MFLHNPILPFSPQAKPLFRSSRNPTTATPAQAAPQSYAEYAIAQPPGGAGATGSTGSEPVKGENPSQTLKTGAKSSSILVSPRQVSGEMEGAGEGGLWWETLLQILVLGSVEGGLRFTHFVLRSSLFIPSFITSCVNPFLYSFIDIYVPSFMRSLIPLLVHKFLYVFICSFIRIYIPSFIPSFMRSSILYIPSPPFTYSAMARGLGVARPFPLGLSLCSCPQGEHSVNCCPGRGGAVDVGAGDPHSGLCFTDVTTLPMSPTIIYLFI